MIRTSLPVLVVLVATCGAQAQERPKLLSVAKIWDAGKHNAFTDLLRWRGKWYCVFREALAHVGGDGKIRVLESADGEKWRSVALVEEKGIDLRDPHISITPDDRLMLIMGGSDYGGTRVLKGRQPRVSFSKDARSWSPPRRVLTEGEWLWRVTWHEGRAYGVSYNASARTTKEAKEAAKSSDPVSPDPADWKLKLVVSTDGVKYDTITHLGVPGHPNETTLRFLPDGEMLALVRREGGDTFGWLGSSRPPYKDWKWHSTKHRFGGPNFLRLADGSLWASSRSYPGGAKTVLARMTKDSYEPVLTLPSGGDTSYAGLVYHEGVLWISYYSTHEGKSAIYLAKVRLPEEPIDIGSRLDMFVDDLLISRLKGKATLQVQRPIPGEVVLTADAPWEGNTSAYFTVFRDGDRFRMYYRGAHFDEKTRKASHREVTCYAESKDGIAWTKPNLGQFEFDGSKANNIVWDGPGTHNFTPFKDENPKAAPDSRYKALARVPGGLRAYRSADGLHWQPLSPKPVITRGAFDSQNLAFFDPHLGRYREYHRTFRGVRDIMTGTSTDFLHWTPPAFLDYGDAPLEHLYTNAVLPCPRAPHLLLGFPTRFLPSKQQVEPVFMASRDGWTFKRWPEALIPRDAPKDREGNRSNYMAWGLVELPGRPKELSVYATEAYYTGPGSRLRRFIYRTDGFVALQAPAAGGELITRPLRVRGGALIVNGRTGQTGELRVEIQDLQGQPLPGFALADCRPFRGDEIATRIAWKEAPSVGDLANRPIRLRFVLRDAEVFSFRFAD